ncbi:hypothetical protein WDZ92_00875 [Nostoc sp. NIES-2111]
MAFKAKVTGLNPGGAYKYYTQAASLPNLGTPSSGAGNPLFINHGTTALYTTQPNLTTNCGSFTANAQGEYSGWFAFVPTSNRRFNPDTTLLPTITLNDGNGGTTVATRYALDLSVRVLVFRGMNADSACTAIRGSSLASPKNMVALYDNTTASGRPLAITFAEAIGTTIASQPSWYSSNVTGQAGAWGSFIPNTLVGGVQAIVQYDPTGAVVGSNTSTTGAWGNTVTNNSTGGNTTPLVIDAAQAPLNTVTAVQLLKGVPYKAFYNKSLKQILVSTEQDMEMDIYSATGTKVLHVRIPKSDSEIIQTQNWASGIYLLVSPRCSPSRLVIE